MINRVALHLGGNQADRYAILQQATELIQKRIGSVGLSSGLYETEPWGDFGDERPKPFLNQALVVSTRLTAHQVLDEAMAIEGQLGRRRNLIAATPDGQRIYHSRPIDIDIILFNNEVIDSPDLIVPHPRMHLRQFVLEPLAELLPHYVHPLLGKTLSELLSDLKKD